MTSSAPPSTATRAASAEPTCSHTDTPASRSSLTWSAGGCPQWKETIGTRSSTHTSTSSPVGKKVMRLTWNGLPAVRALTSRIISRSRSGGRSAAPIAPMPPALVTAAANSGVSATNAIPAQTNGYRMS